MPVERCEEEDLKSMEAPQFQHTGFFINPSWHMFQSCTNFIDMFLAIRLWFNMRDTNIDGLECVDYTLSFSILVLNYSILYHIYIYTSTMIYYHVYIYCRFVAFVVSQPVVLFLRIRKG